MNLDRFSSLARAYGADIGRWPLNEQAHAKRFIVNDPAATEVLQQAAELDRQLSSWRVVAADADLQRRAVTRLRSHRSSARRRLGPWLSALGAAGLVASGAIAGAAMITMMSAATAPRLGPETYDAFYDQTGFGDIGIPSEAAPDAGAS